MFEELFAEAIIMVVTRLDRPETKTATRQAYEKQVNIVEGQLTAAYSKHDILVINSEEALEIAHGEIEIEVDGLVISPRFGEFERALEGTSAEKEAKVISLVTSIKEEVQASKEALEKLEILSPKLKRQALKNMRETDEKIKLYTEYGSAAGNIAVIGVTAALAGVAAPITIITAVTGVASHAYVVWDS